MGVLETLSGQHVGTGRERRYGAEAVYLAAVLLGLGDLGLPIGVLKTIASRIEADLSNDEGSAALWEEAKRPQKALPGEVKRPPRRSRAAACGWGWPLRLMTNLLKRLSKWA